MQPKTKIPTLLSVLILVLAAFGCVTPPPPPTSTPKPTSTHKPTRTPKPSATPKPTRTPDLAATKQAEERQAEVLDYYDRGYLPTTDGVFKELNGFRMEWAQLRWYRKWIYDYSVSDFFMSGHFRWSSAYRSADLSGCGFVFALQPEGNEHYAVFLDRSKVYFVHTKQYYRAFSPTRGTGRVKFDNPFDHAVEADFTLIVIKGYAYVLVNNEVVGEYTLSQSKSLEGRVGLALLSGTNKDFGTRCDVTNLHVWHPTE